LGNLLDEKAQASSPSAYQCFLGAGKAHRQACVMLRLAADEERTRSAGDATESFYRLVEAEGRLDLLRLSQTEVNESLMRTEELQAKGLPHPEEPEVIRKQLTDLRSDEVNVRIAVLQLNSRLKVLLGLSCDECSLWPLADLKVVADVPDIDEAVDYGLHHRPDLALLGTLTFCLDVHSLKLASQALGAVNPLLSDPSSSNCCAAALANLDSGKYCSTKEQLQTLIVDRTRQATEEIREAVGEVSYRVQLVILARQNVESEEHRIKELEEQKTKGLDVEEDLSTARLNLYKAQGEELREVINWKIARAKLLQEQGSLLEECALLNDATKGAMTIQSAPTQNELPQLQNPAANSSSNEPARSAQ
jgi:hypothetical protein